MLGRVYVAQEGVNAQVSVPDNMMELFTATVANVPELAGVYLNKDEPLPVTSAPFVKLQVKPRKQVLADGLGSKGYDWSNNGKMLQPVLWHHKLQLVQQKAPNAPLLLDATSTRPKWGRLTGPSPLIPHRFAVLGRPSKTNLSVCLRIERSSPIVQCPAPPSRSE